MSDVEREEAAMERRPTNGRAFWAFVLGAAADVVLASLYAPASGAATRGYLIRRALAGERRANALLKKGFNAMESGRSRVSSAVEEGRTRWESLKAHAESALDQGLEAAARIAEYRRQAAEEVRNGIGRIGATVNAAGHRS